MEGQGSGWHGESVRHRIARMMGMAPSNELPSQINSQPQQGVDSQMSDDELRARIEEIQRAQQAPVQEDTSSDDDEKEEKESKEKLNIEEF